VKQNLLTQICRATCYTIPSIVCGTLQSRYQILLLSYNMFVNSQCNLPKPVFSHGQLYVPLSRVRSLGSLSVVSETNEIVISDYNDIY
jgi:hypothetical protein